jgi:hypothetical protein
MIRTIAIAAIAFGIAAFTLHRASLGAFEEPLLLLALGTVFLLTARLLGAVEHSVPPSADDEPQLVPERRRTTA